MKDKRIDIRISNEDYIQIKGKANKEGKSVSCHMRDIALEEKIRSDNPEKRCRIAEMLREAEGIMRSEEDKNILRQVGERLWEM